MWSIRRYKGTVVLFIEASAQILNLSFFVIPNVYVLVRPCGWRDDIVLWSAFVSWTCWNTLFLLTVVRIRCSCGSDVAMLMHMLPVHFLDLSNSFRFISVRHAITTALATC